MEDGEGTIKKLLEIREISERFYFTKKLVIAFGQFLMLEYINNYVSHITGRFKCCFFAYENLIT